MQKLTAVWLTCLSLCVCVLQSLPRTMLELTAVWLVCVLAGTSCAVFYTKSSDNDYPRMGRRAFFTGGVKGSNYPRIGRSSPGFGADDVMSGYDSHFLSPSKRGIFTAGDRGFPRIGRGGARRLGSHELSAAAAVVTSVEAPDVLGSEEQTRFELPVGLLFFEFDKDGE